MIKGEKITVGGEEMILPPLNLDDVEQYWVQLIDGSLFKDLNACAQIFHSALVRNYPDLTLEDLKKKMRPGELVLNLPILMKQSGFVVPGETPGGSKKSPTGKA
jgi:hypothetical protein